MPENRTASPIDSALADVLVAAYKGRRMSQADLVEKTGISVPTMQRLMAGRTRFDVEQLFKIADAIGGRTAAQYVAEAEAIVAERASQTGLSAAPANVTHINTRKGDSAQWQGEQHAIEELDAVAKDSKSVIEVSPEDVTP